MGGEGRLPQPRGRAHAQVQRRRDAVEPAQQLGDDRRRVAVGAERRGDGGEADGARDRFNRRSGTVAMARDAMPIASQAGTSQAMTNGSWPPTRIGPRRLGATLSRREWIMGTA